MVAILTRGVANLPGLLSRRTRPFASTKRFKLLHMPQPPFTLKFGLAILPMYNPCHKVVQILIWVSSCGTSISTWAWGFVIPPPLQKRHYWHPLLCMHQCCLQWDSKMAGNLPLCLNISSKSLGGPSAPVYLWQIWFLRHKNFKFKARKLSPQTRWAGYLNQVTHCPLLQLFINSMEQVPPFWAIEIKSPCS